MTQPKVLNVGGNSKAIALPPIFDGYEHLLLDIDPTGKPDLLCDARELTSTPAAQYDAVYCSHNLEHYFRHDVPRVLAGFIHVLKLKRGAIFGANSLRYLSTFLFALCAKELHLRQKQPA